MRFKGIGIIALALLAAIPARALEESILLAPGREALREFGSSPTDASSLATTKGGTAAFGEWRAEGARLRRGFRGGLEFALSHDAYAPSPDTDLLLHFDSAELRDEAGRWIVAGGPAYASDPERALLGGGAASFRGPDSSLSLAPGAKSLFARDSRFRDFSVEFWLYPANAENGEIILMWQSVRKAASGILPQQLSCVVAGGRVSWNFVNFFGPPEGMARSFPAETQIELKAKSPLMPRAWSHHLLRFDGDTGLLEYLVDGIPEAIAYATSTGREGIASTAGAANGTGAASSSGAVNGSGAANGAGVVGAANGTGPANPAQAGGAGSATNGLAAANGAATVFAPAIGAAAPLRLAADYAGLVDEFRLSSSFVENPRLKPYGRDPASVFSPIADLGFGHSRLLAIQAEFQAPGASGLELSYRMAEEAAGWKAEEPAWIPLRSGQALPETALGRYVQVRAELYPDGSGRLTPSLSAIRLRYEPDPPPPPPARLLALPRDGAIELRWTKVPEADLAGYLVYYGDAPGEYFGTGASQGPSPVDAGLALSLVLSGLPNGRLLYITVAAYDLAGLEGPAKIGAGSAGTGLARPGYAEKAPTTRAGEFSEEIAVRPSRTAP